MGTNTMLLVKKLLTASGLTLFGMSSPGICAEIVPAYCSVALCSSSQDAISIKQSLGIGDASLGWWDCRIQSKCQDISNSIQNLPLDVQNCTIDKLISYRKDIAKLNDTLQGLLSQFGTQTQEALGAYMREGLTNDLMEHFKKCYAAGLFIADPKKCVTEECEKFVEGINNLQVNQEDCTNQLSQLCPTECESWDFTFEQPLVFDKYNAFREKCINANFIPAMTAYDLPIYKKDVPFAEKCLATGGGLQYEIVSLNVTPSGCSVAIYNDLSHQVVDFEKDLAKLEELSPAQDVGDSWPQRMGALLNKKIEHHFAKCEEEDLFPSDKAQCLSQQCKQLEAEIQSFKVNEEDCKKKLTSLVVKTPFLYENKLIQSKLADFKERCIAGDALPYKQIGSTWVTKSEYEARYQAVQSEIDSKGLEGEKTWPDSDLKIIPYAKLVSAVKGFKVNKEHCNFNRYIAPLRGNIDKYILLWRDAGFKIPASLDELSNLLSQYLFNCVDKNSQK